MLKTKRAGRKPIPRDLEDVALIEKVNICWIPFIRIERECNIPKNSLKYYVKSGHIPPKHRTNLKKYFIFIASKLW